MRYCPSCKVNIEGAFEHCPLCQNGLQGDAGEAVYPFRQELRKQSYLYKIQLFILIALMLISVVVDFVLEIKGHFHWSILVAAWVIGGEYILNKLIKRHNNPSWILFFVSLWLAILIGITLVLIGHSSVFFVWVLPSMALAVEITHFVFMMTDKSQNAMIYLLGSSAVFIITAIIYLSANRSKELIWLILLLASVICVVGAVIFKGKKVVSELQKRFHL